MAYRSEWDAEDIKILQQLAITHEVFLFLNFFGIASMCFILPKKEKRS